MNKKLETNRFRHTGRDSDIAVVQMRRTL